MIGFRLSTAPIHILRSGSSFTVLTRSSFTGLQYQRHNSFEVLRVTTDGLFETGYSTKHKHTVLCYRPLNIVLPISGLRGYSAPYLLFNSAIYEHLGSGQIVQLSKYSSFGFVSENSYVSVFGNQFEIRDLRSQQLYKTYPANSRVITPVWKHGQKIPFYFKVYQPDIAQRKQAVLNYDFSKFETCLPFALTMTNTTQLLNIMNMYYSWIRTVDECRDYFLHAARLNADVLWVPTLFDDGTTHHFFTARERFTLIGGFYFDIDVKYQSVREQFSELLQEFGLSITHEIQSSSGNYHCRVIKPGTLTIPLSEYLSFQTEIQLAAYKLGILIDVVSRNFFQSYFCPGPLPILKKGCNCYAHFIPKD